MRGNGELTTDLVKGVIAGAAGTWAMDQVTQYMYSHEGPAAFLREKEAQVEGKYATTVLAEKAARLVGKQLTETRAEAVGLGIHWTTGALFGAAHSALRSRVPVLGAGHGIVHGVVFWLLVDEAAKPLLGASAGPAEFPWQSHARGLAGHLVLGAVTDIVLDVLDLVV
jgi:hypothetical protein